MLYTLNGANMSYCSFSPLYDEDQRIVLFSGFHWIFVAINKDNDYWYISASEQPCDWWQLIEQPQRHLSINLAQVEGAAANNSFFLKWTPYSLLGCSEILRSLWDICATFVGKIDRVTSGHGAMDHKRNSLRPIFHRNLDLCRLIYCYWLECRHVWFRSDE